MIGSNNAKVDKSDELLNDMEYFLSIESELRTINPYEMDKWFGCKGYVNNKVNMIISYLKDLDVNTFVS